MLDVVEAAKGNWQFILGEFGVADSFLRNEHGPCPLCGGKDRFRFDNRGGRGTFFCSQCGHGDGFDLLQKFTGHKFSELKDRVLQAANLHHQPTTTTNQAASTTTSNIAKMKALWHRAKTPTTNGPVEQYMIKRLGRVFKRPAIRESFLYHEQAKTTLPAMICMYTTTTGEPCSLHITYLTSTGDKAGVTPNRRNIKGGRLPAGCAIRLSRVESSVIGIAEGIETALSCEILFGIPVWAAGNAGTLSNWSPPRPDCNVVIFGDCDKSYTGQAKAYDLANKLTTKKKALGIAVKLPGLDCGDWNDILKAHPHRF